MISKTTGQWLYIKIYTGTRSADRILSEVLYPYWLEMNKQSLAESWFYIRYSDPDFHLRFRLKIAREENILEHYDRINVRLASLKRSGLVWKVDQTMYEQEYERYGTSSMQMAENIFCADSNAFMQFLNKESSFDDDIRWIYSIASINNLLDDFTCSPEEKKALLLDLNRSFGDEFGKDRKLAAQLSQKYRKYRIHIAEILEGMNPVFDDIFRARSLDQKEAVSGILRLLNVREIEVDRSSLISSFIHMSMNRIFRNNNRLYEMVIYDLLFRHYKSMLNWNKNSKL